MEYRCPECGGALGDRDKQVVSHRIQDAQRGEIAFEGVSVFICRKCSVKVLTNQARCRMDKVRRNGYLPNKTIPVYDLNHLKKVEPEPKRPVEA